LDSLWIESFLAVVRHGTLTEAATSLFLSQSTLSHRIMQLEKAVGTNLIDRGRGIKSLSLTPAGEEFLKLARKWEELINETKFIRDSTKKDKLIIGSVDSVHNFLLPPVYRSLISHSQEIELVLKTYIGFELYSLIEQGEIDIAFALFEKPVPNLIVEKFYSEPMVVIRNEDKADHSFRLIKFRDLDRANELYHEWSPSFRTWYERSGEGIEFSGVRVDSAGLILTLLENPGRWSIIPMSMARKFAALGTYSLYKLEDSPPDRAYYKIRQRFPRSSAVESLALLESKLKLVKEPFEGLNMQ